MSEIRQPLTVVVVGATGLVGRTMLQILAEREFPIGDLRPMASARSAGVSTVPTARGQGIGAAITQVPLREAREMGYRIGILHSTPMGMGVYTRLGFVEYCRMSHYFWMSA